MPRLEKWGWWAVVDPRRCGRLLLRLSLRSQRVFCANELGWLMSIGREPLVHIIQIASLKNVEIEVA